MNTPYEVKYVSVRRLVQIDDDHDEKQNVNPDNDVVGVQAVADVTMRLKAHPAGYSVSFPVCSSGLWEIEAESMDDPYLADVYRDQVSELREILAALGIGPEMITMID